MEFFWGMGSGTKTGRGTRPRGTRIDVWVTEGELAELADRADQAGMSRSAYLRTTGLNHKIRSVYDLRAVSDMGKVNGDLGRIAGLLKLWLADHRGFGAKPAEVEKMMLDFRALQAELSAITGRALRTARPASYVPDHPICSVYAERTGTAGTLRSPARSVRARFVF